MSWDPYELISVHEVFERVGTRWVLLRTTDGCEYEFRAIDAKNAVARSLENEDHWTEITTVPTQKDVMILDAFEDSLVPGEKYTMELLLQLMHPGAPFLIREERGDAVQIMKVDDDSIAVKFDYLDFEWTTINLKKDRGWITMTTTLVDWFETEQSRLGQECTCEWISVLQRGCTCGSIRRYQEVA